MRVCTCAALGGRLPASCGTRKTASRGSRESWRLSTDSRRSRLSVSLAHINGPEQCLAFRHETRERMAHLQGPYRHPIMALRAAGCLPADLGASFGGPHPAKHLHSRPPSAHTVIGDTRRGGYPEFSPLRAC